MSKNFSFSPEMQAEAGPNKRQKETCCKNVCIPLRWPLTGLPKLETRLASPTVHALLSSSKNCRSCPQSAESEGTLQHHHDNLYLEISFQPNENPHLDKRCSTEIAQECMR